MFSFLSVNIEPNEWYTYHDDVNVWIVIRKLFIQQCLVHLTCLFMRMINW